MKQLWRSQVPAPLYQHSCVRMPVLLSTLTSALMCCICVLLSKGQQVCCRYGTGVMQVRCGKVACA